MDTIEQVKNPVPESEQAPEAPQIPEVEQSPEIPQSPETESSPQLPASEPAAETSETLDVVYPEDDEKPAAPKKRIRPETTMGIIAALTAVLLLVMVALAWPQFTAKEEDVPAVTFGEEDPEALLRHHADDSTEITEEVIIEPTIEETEPENPTIPPESNPYDRFDFQYNRYNYLLLQNHKSHAGIDVSSYQNNIDWKKVKRSGIEFAIIRLGYRGYGQAGKLVEDTFAKKNLQGASEAGLKIGAYFFSQALTIREVDEEISFMLKILGDYELDMPIVLDWEIPAAEARTAKMDARTLTDLQRHFCEVMTEKGYQPMIYFNWHQSENLYYLSELEDYPFWLALYQDRMTYPWKIEMWQWTCTGKVPGIYGDVDINVYMPY